MGSGMTGQLDQVADQETSFPEVSLFSQGAAGPHPDAGSTPGESKFKGQTQEGEKSGKSLTKSS